MALQITQLSKTDGRLRDRAGRPLTWHNCIIGAPETWKSTIVEHRLHLGKALAERQAGQPAAAVDHIT